MTAPPYECPMSTTGPPIAAANAAMAAESNARLRSGLGGASTVCPALCSSRISPPKPEASANAPCTSTAVGVDVVVMGCASFAHATTLTITGPDWPATNMACPGLAVGHEFL